VNLEDKVVLITGSSKGIGASTAKAFAKEGAKVIITYNTDRKGGEAIKNQCEDSYLIPLDVTSEKSIELALEKIRKKYGKLDILVNNAGIIFWNVFEKQSLEELESQVRVNLIGMMKVTSIFLPLLKKQKEALIINIASGAGKKVYGMLVPYCATKFGVRAFTQGLAIELPRKIRTYVVNPGMTATQMTGFKGIPPEKVASIILNTAKETYKKKSGQDVDVQDYV
jgi:NAD(P)-dependent dehydrogenase (short-subunit alcohol dehydrogenase family)